MSSSIPGTPGVTGESPAVELNRLHAAICEALSLCGLSGLEDAFVIYLQSVSGRLVKQGIVDLSVLWQPFTEDDSIDRKQAARALLLIYLYIENVLKAKVAASEQVRAEIEGAIQTAKDLDAALPKLVQGIERRLQQRQDTTAQELSAKEAKKKAEEAKKKEKEAKKKEKEGRKPRGPFAAKSESKLSKTQLVALGIVSTVLIGGMSAYWINIYLDVHKHQEEYRKTHITIDLDTVSRVLPATEARAGGHVLFVISKDGSFAKQPEAQQLRTGTLLLRAVNAPALNTVQVKSGDAVTYIEKTPAGMKAFTIQPPPKAN